MDIMGVVCAARGRKVSVRTESCPLDRGMEGGGRGWWGNRSRAREGGRLCGDGFNLYHRARMSCHYLHL